MPDVHACHCFDLPFLLRNFEKWAGAPFLQGLDQEEAKRISDEYSGYLIRFVKTGKAWDEPGKVVKIGSN